MKWYKKIMIVLLIVLIAIQFIRPARNNSTASILSTDITHTVNVPDTVLAILKNSCYDCHSNKTRYPWYANVQPVAWWLAGHIKDGKRSLNFSEFGSYTLRRKQNKLKSIGNEVEEGGMPLSSYTLIHTNAKITAEEKRIIKDWVAVAKDSLDHKN